VCVQSIAYADYNVLANRTASDLVIRIRFG